MSAWELLEQKQGEVGPWLRRAFWLPLRRMLRMFHIVPVTAAAVVFVLLATDGQVREIYVSYLEDLAAAPAAAIALRLAVAAIGFALISAVLYEAHYLLNAARLNVIYSINAELGINSMLRHVQDVTAIVLALSPWLGLATGLLHAKIYLAGLFKTLSEAYAASNAQGVASMQHVPMPGPWAIVAGVLALGLVMAYFAAAYPKSRTLQRPVIIATPAAATLVFLLLTTSPQVNPTLPQVIKTCAGVTAVTAFYYVVYARLQTMRALVFSRALQQETGFNLRGYHGLLLFAWALLPWIAAIALYFVVGAPAAGNGLHSWAMISVVISWVLATGLLVALVLYHYRDNAGLKWILYGAVGSLALIGLLVSWFPPDIIVTLYRLIGPLASLAFALLFLISILVILGVLSQRSGFPALTLVLLALLGSVLVPIPIEWTAALLSILCFAIFFVAVVARFGAVAWVAIILALTGAINFAKLHGLREVNLRQSAGAPVLQAQFDAWLDHTKNAAPASDPAGGVDAAAPASCAAANSNPAKPYPVFIIAVEGGGIYAASAASMFLARLQDRDPCFAQHVFAISAVSGGAIGATIFQAVEQSPQAPTAAPNSDPSARGCVPPGSALGRNPAASALEMEVCAIIQDDHFSPLVASIFPELLGFTRSGRAQELAESFDDSVKHRNPDAGKILDETFDEFAADWSKNSKAPALVLNSTWVETGFRAAFAPFPLHAIDGSLYSFVDQNMPDDVNLTVLKAALVSARFPAVLPPYTLLIRKNSPAGTSAGKPIDGSADPNGTVRWNFVDGGYSDTSGAATALALYEALEPAAKARNVALRVILLTSSDPRLEPDDINGTAFADTLGPINAMLSVRDGLGNEAVARACDGILGAGVTGPRSESKCAESAGQSDSPLQIVGIEDQTYGLSLGWKISQTTFGVVSWMLGEPEFARAEVCKGQSPSSGPTPQSNGQFTLNEKVVCANSRVQQEILQSLK